MYFNPLLKATRLAWLVVAAAGGTVCGQDSAAGVSVRMHLTASAHFGNQSHGFQVYSTVMESSDHPSGAAAISVSAPGNVVATDSDTFRYEPGKAYVLSLLPFNNGGFDLKIEAPLGYQVELDGVVRTKYSGSQWQSGENLTLRVVGSTAISGRAGAASSLQNGQAVWQVALGNLVSGRPAGALVMNQPSAGNDWSVTPAALHYEARDEVDVYRENGNIRQILLNEAVVDVVTLSPSAYEIRFYPYSRNLWGSQPHTFSGFPYVTYKVEKVSATKLKITSETRDLAATTSGNVPTSGSVIGVVNLAAPIARTAETTVERTGSGASADWTLKDWNTVGQPQRGEDYRDNSASGALRTETTHIREPGGSTATQTTRVFQTFAWGEDVVSVTRGSASSAGGPAVVTNYAYYTNSDVSGSYSQVKSISTVNGGWEAFEYDPNNFGVVTRRHRPWENSPASVPADLPSNTSGEITNYTYEPDVFGRLTRPTLIETRVNGTLVAKATITYTTMTANGNEVIVATRLDHTGNGSSTLQTIIKYFSESPSLANYRSRTHSVTHPDGRKETYAYQSGTWNGTTFTAWGPNSSGGIATPTRTVVIRGTTQSSGNSLYGTHGNYDIDDVYLVAGKSTMDVAIYDSRVNLVRSETYVWTGTDWSSVPVSAVSYTYNLANQLTARLASDGALHETAYSGEFTSSETDPAGTEHTFTYDHAGRLASIAQTSGPTTTFSYNAAGQVLSETVSATGITETIVASRTYDDAGRLRTASPPGLGATTYGYSSSRVRTATMPDSATRTETYFADGRIEKVEGSAVVPEIYAYAVELDGRRTTTIRSGGLSGTPTLANPSSPRWRKITADWIGRTARTERPGFASQPAYVEDYTYEAITGRLLKRTESGPTSGSTLVTRYEYDALSQVVRSGLDLGDNGLVLASNDRIADANRYFEYWNSTWWLRTDTTAYPTANSATPVTTSLARIRLTGLSSGGSEARITDAEGNIATTTTTISRSTKTVTISTARTGLSDSASQTIVNGLTTNMTGHDSLSTTLHYDALRRLWKSTDSRNNTTITAYYPGTGLVQTVTDATGNQVGAAAYDTSGRATWTRDAANHYTYFSYNARSQPLRQWGGGAYPAEYGYDSVYGDRTTLKTYRGGTGWDGATWPTSPGTADATTWNFDGASGLVSSKVDASNRTISFTYNQRGQLATRSWARGVTTTYNYDGGTGEPTGQSYSDATPEVSYSYTRLGQPDTVTDATGTRDFVYDPAKPWRLSAEAMSSYYGSRVITSLYDSGNIVGRGRGFQLGASAGSNSDLEQTWGYTSAGRFDTLATKRVSNSISRSFQYGYRADAPLVNALAVVGGSFSVNYDHETQRDLLTTIDAKWSTTSRTRYDYTYNGLGQRVTAKQSGSAFDDFGGSTYYRYVYNGRGEVTQAVNYLGEDPGSTSSPQLTGRRFGYAHDTIGNRTSATRALGTSVSDLFSANALNQYSSRENDVTYVAGTAQTDSAIAVTGGTAAANIGRAGRYWGAEVTVANANHPAKADLTLSATLPGNLVRTENRAAYLAQALQTFSYDHDGNLTGDGIWSYVYDGENRLVQMTTTATAVSFGFPNRTLEFKYDYLGRRVQKRSATANANTYRRYLYDGWNLVAEFDAPGGVSCGALLRSYTWGLDLAGSPSATGGVGALVQITDHGSSTSYFPTYDGNGNVASLLNAADGSVAAKYEYSPFGELLRAEGAYASSNPFRFSTKFTDDESGLVYYGHRYYDPKNGRFINRDPISESGGLNLYGFCGNDGVNGWEYLGLFPEGSVASGDQRAVDDSMIGDPRRPFADSSGVIHPRNEPVTTAGPAGTAVQLGQEAGARIRNSGPNPNEKKGSEADQAARFAAQGLFAKPGPNSIAAERARIWAGARPGSTIYAGDMDDEIPYEGYDSIDRAIRAAREAQAYRIIMETPEFQMLEMELKAFMSLHPAGALNNTLHEPTNPWNYVELATTSGGGQIIRVGGVVVGVVVIKAGKPVVRLAKQAMFNAMRFHHAWPKYLGGRISQILEPLPKALHDVYHSGLDKILPRQASKAHYDSLSPKAFEQALRDLKAYTQAFDAKYGTSLYEAMVREGFPF